MESRRRGRYGLADALAARGFEEGHWYANWRMVQDGVWLIIAGRREIRSQFEGDMMAYLFLHSTRPPELGDDFEAPESKVRALAESVRPGVEKMLKELGCEVLPETVFPDFP